MAAPSNTSHPPPKIVRKLARLWQKCRNRVNVELDYLQFRKQSKEDGRFPNRFRDRRLCIKDKTATSGFDRAYIYHCAWAAGVLGRSRPTLHIDISSLLYFSTIVSGFVPVKFYDYRPANLHLPNLTSLAGDLLALPFPDHSVESISCLHVVEHIGLGRYGDPLDARGDLKAIAELKRVVRPGGQLLFVVPVGRVRIRFNANRIYSYMQIMQYFADMELVEHALITEHGDPDGLILNPPRELYDRQSEGCGCFWFRAKKEQPQSGASQ